MSPQPSLAAAVAALCLAAAAVAQEPTSPEAVAARFFEALETQDAEALRAVLAEDVTTTLPFGVNGATATDALTRYEGREATAAYFGGVAAYLAEIAFVESQVTPGADGTTVFVENLGDMTFADDRPYQNRYVWRFTVEDGEITALTEYANPVAAGLAFGLPFGPQDPADPASSGPGSQD